MVKERAMEIKEKRGGDTMVIEARHLGEVREAISEYVEALSRYTMELPPQVEDLLKGTLTSEKLAGLVRKVEDAPEIRLEIRPWGARSSLSVSSESKIPENIDLQSASRTVKLAILLEAAARYRSIGGIKSLSKARKLEKEAIDVVTRRKGIKTSLRKTVPVLVLALVSCSKQVEAMPSSPTEPVPTEVVPALTPTPKTVEEPTPTVPPIPDSGVGEVPYPSSIEGFGQVGGNPEELGAGIMELSGGDLANVEFLLKWRLWKEYNEAHPNKMLEPTQKAVDQYFANNFEFKYAFVEGKSWTVAVQNQEGNFWIAQDQQGNNYLSFIPLGARTIDDFKLSEVETPQWADSQKLIPVVEGESRGHFVIGFYKKGALVGWFDAIDNEAVFIPQIPEVLARSRLLLKENGYFIEEGSEAARLVYQKGNVQSSVLSSVDGENLVIVTGEGEKREIPQEALELRKVAGIDTERILTIKNEKEEIEYFYLPPVDISKFGLTETPAWAEGGWVTPIEVQTDPTNPENYTMITPDDVWSGRLLYSELLVAEPFPEGTVVPEETFHYRGRWLPMGYEVAGMEDWWVKDGKIRYEDIKDRYYKRWVAFYKTITPEGEEIIVATRQVLSTDGRNFYLFHQAFGGNWKADDAFSTPFTDPSKYFSDKERMTVDNPFIYYIDPPGRMTCKELFGRFFGKPMEGSGGCVFYEESWNNPFLFLPDNVRQNIEERVGGYLGEAEDELKLFQYMVLITTPRL